MNLHRMQDVALALQMVNADATAEIGEDPQANYENLDKLANSVSTLGEAVDRLAEEVEGRLADAERKADAAGGTEA